MGFGVSRGPTIGGLREPTRSGRIEGIALNFGYGEYDEFKAAVDRLIPNYGERWRYGEAIATGFVESTVNQVISKRFVKQQQMKWSPRGAHLLLQMRTRLLNGELR